MLQPSVGLSFAPFSIFAHFDVVVFVSFVSYFVLVSYDFNIHKLYIIYIEIQTLIYRHIYKNVSK
jgi:hypothetical protein